MIAPLVKGRFVAQNRVNCIVMNGHWSFVHTEPTTVHLSLPPELHQKNRTVRHSTTQR